MASSRLDPRRNIRFTLQEKELDIYDDNYGRLDAQGGRAPRRQRFATPGPVSRARARRAGGPPVGAQRIAVHFTRGASFGRCQCSAGGRDHS
eukprot:6552658-Pyramimonas_sp.AAC.1